MEKIKIKEEEVNTRNIFLTMSRKERIYYIFKYIFFYLVATVSGFIVPQITESKVAVSKFINIQDYLIFNTQFNINILGRLCIIILGFIVYITFILKYKNEIDKEWISVKTISLLQKFIYITGFLQGLQLSQEQIVKNVIMVFNREFIIGLMSIGILLLIYRIFEEDCDKEIEHREKTIDSLYPSRKLARKKMKYLLEEDLVSSILVDGDWGIGKTFFISTVLESDKNKYDILKYDALLYGTREKLMKAFFKDLKMLAKKNGFLVGDSYDYLVMLEPILTKFPLGLGKLLLKENSSENLKREFKSFIERFKNSIIVVIDNLERINQKDVFIEVISFFHELNDFRKIKVIMLLDTKKIKTLGIPEGYIDKFFIHRIDLKEIPIEDILYEEFLKKKLEENIDLYFIVDKLEEVKEKRLKKFGKLENINNFHNPRIYEQVINRFNVNIESYENVYISEISDDIYKKYMLLSSLFYFLLPNLEGEELDELMPSEGDEAIANKIIRRDYFDTGTDIRDQAKNIVDKNIIGIKIEKYLEEILYYHNYICNTEPKLKEKYLCLLKELTEKKGIKLKLLKIENYSINNLFDLRYEVLKLEKELKISSEESIVNILRKNLDKEKLEVYIENLIKIYQIEIEEIQNYVAPLGKVLSLKSILQDGSVSGKEEFEDILDIYFSEIKPVNEHFENISNAVKDGELKEKLNQFAYKYKKLS